MHSSSVGTCPFLLACGKLRPLYEYCVRLILTDAPQRGKKNPFLAELTMFNACRRQVGLLTIFQGMLLHDKHDHAIADRSNRGSWNSIWVLTFSSNTGYTAVFLSFHPHGRPTLLSSFLFHLLYICINISLLSNATSMRLADGFGFLNIWLGKSSVLIWIFGMLSQVLLTSGINVFDIEEKWITIFTKKLT